MVPGAAGFALHVPDLPAVDDAPARPAPRRAPPGPDDGVPRLSAVRLALALLALGFGGFAIGATEFVTMGLLPDIARGVGVDIPTGGT